MSTADDRIAELEERLAGLYDKLDQATTPEFVQPDTGGPKGIPSTKQGRKTRADELRAMAAEARQRGDHKEALKLTLEATHLDESKRMPRGR